MSWLPDKDPVLGDTKSCDALELVIVPRTRDLGDGFAVRRALPHGRRQMVGPFIFFDHFGPVEFAPGSGIDVRPHPHVALAAITYLFEGELVHRDSLGCMQVIRPGEVNWMLAGAGIVHSERSSPEWRRHGGRMHGIQSWVALPVADEERAPRFDHHAAIRIPIIQRPGARLRLISGAAFGASSPVAALSPTLYVDAMLDVGAAVPIPDEVPERALYVVEGAIECDGQTLSPGTMAVLRPGAAPLVRALTRAHAMVIGGAPPGGERYIEWNFVASSRERIERAKRDWKKGRFPKVPGDEIEFIPLPD